MEDSSGRGAIKTWRGNRKFLLSTAGKKVAEVKGAGWVCKAKSVAQALVQAGTCLTSVSPSESKNVQRE